MAKYPRVRMFAGPNGSGKSTFKTIVGPKLLGRYINPDEIEQGIRKRGFLELADFSVQQAADEIVPFFHQSEWLKKHVPENELQKLLVEESRLLFPDISVNSYYAAVTADFLRHKLLDAGISFTFETVMSARDKVDFLKYAQTLGYHTYLYYVATEDPLINISRVENRVHLGGHPVPEEKIVERYHRSLDLLWEAIAYTNRAYIYDNSPEEADPIWLAEITNGTNLEYKADIMPKWFERAILDKVDLA